MNEILAHGTRLGPYEILEVIGSGGMGRVYRAWDARLGRHVAIKTIAESTATNAEALRRFESEARATGALNHPNVLLVFDIGQEAGVSYIVSELLEGETLHVRLQRGALPERQVIDFAAQIARGLEAAHGRGVVHRDLKPANLFFTRDRRVKILDFGIAKLAESTGRGAETVTAHAPTVIGAPMGTAGYMSPEQVRGEPVDGRTDIFSLGVVMHEMLTGTRPFQRHTTADTFSAILTQEPAGLTDTVNPLLGRIVRCCLEKSSEERFHSAHDLALALEMIPGTLPSATPGLPDPVRRRALIYGASALGLGAAGVAGGALLRSFGTAQAQVPSFQRLTFRRGLVRSARLAPDGQTVLFGALWDGDVCRVYSTRVDNPESRALDLPGANLLAVSRTGELALSLGANLDGVFTYGTLARVPIAGGAPRELVEDVKFADWSPDGSELALIRRVDGRDQLEFPAGKVLLRPSREEGIGLGFARVSGDGQRVAYVHLRDLQSLIGRVCVIERDGRTTVLSDEYVNIHGLTWHGDRIFYTASDSVLLLRGLFVVKPGVAPRVVARMPVNVALWDAAPDGRLLMAQVDDRGVMIGRLPGEGDDREFSWLDVSWISAISRDGKQLLFGESGQGVGSQPAAYLRGIDGSAAVRLASGWPLTLSPDGRKAVIASGEWAFNGSGMVLEIVPVGAGDATRIPLPSMSFSGAWWPPSGNRIVIRARQGERQDRLYTLELPDGMPVPISPEGVGSSVLSPDGARMAARGPGNAIRLYPLDGGEPDDVPGIIPGDAPVGWIDDGLLVMRLGDGSVPRGDVQLVDPLTGSRSPWHNILPRDAAGIMLLGTLRTTPDGRTRVYTWHRALCTLYLATGLT